MFAAQVEQHEDGEDYIYVPLEDNPNLEYRIKRTEPIGGNDGPKLPEYDRSSDSEANNYPEKPDSPIRGARDVRAARTLGQEPEDARDLNQMRHADGSKVDPLIKRKALHLSKRKGEPAPTVVDDAAVKKGFRETNPDLVSTLDQIDTLEERVVNKMEQILKSLLQEALAPIYQFIGSIEASASGQQNMFQYYYGLKMGNKTLFDFKLNNRHLGENVLYVAAEYARKLAGVKVIDKTDVEFVGAGLKYPRMTVNQKILHRGDFDLDKDGAPEWIWCMIGKPCIRFMLKNHTFGAIAMAAKELGYPEIKPLLDSDDVSYMFAQFVANKFMTGPNIQANAMYGGNMQYRVSSGLMKSQANSKWLMGCKRWFKEVYWGANMKRAQEVAKAKEELDKAVQTKADYPQNVQAQQNFLDAQRNLFLAECQPERLLYHDDSRK